MPSKKLTKMHPADAASALEDLAKEEAVKKLKELKPTEAAEPLEVMDPWESSRLLDDLTTELKAEILKSMDPDDSVDILQEFSPEDRNKILNHFDQDSRKKLSVLLEYPEDTAGGIMSPEIITLPEDITIEQAIEELRKQEDKFETINYTYVVNQGGRLSGVLSFRDLTFRNPQLKLSQIMRTGVHSIPPEMDREEVARLFDKYDFLALPVVDKNNQMLGVVTVDDVIDILRQEDTEDMLGMVGVSEAREESILTPWRDSFKHRFPWLFINLGTAFLAAFVVGLFEGVITKIAVLAVFMPVIAGQGGNSGSQTVAILVRSIALGDIKEGHEFLALLKETWLGLVHGLLIGLAVGGITFLWKGQLLLAVTVAAAMILSMITAGIAGVCIPLGLRALGLDPALSSTIWMTTITDVAGFFFLLGLASWLLV